MTHQAVINYVDGSIGSTSIKVREEEHYHEPFVIINGELLLDKVIQANSKGFLINYDEEIRDGWLSGLLEARSNQSKSVDMSIDLKLSRQSTTDAR